MSAAKVDVLSAAVFGSSKRLSLLSCIATAEEAELFAAALAEKCGGRANQVGQDLKRLEEVGLLRIRPVAGSNRQYYSKNASVLWDLAVKLEAETVRKRPR